MPLTLSIKLLSIACLGLLTILCVHQSISNIGVGRKTVFVAKTVRRVQKDTKKDRALDQTIMEDDTLAPKIAWVLAYPCTGSDFVIDIIHKLTLKNTATNYGHLVEEASGILSRNVYDSTPLFLNRMNGPFLFTKHLPLPVKTFIPTLSYCGGYCAHCYPGKYVMSRDIFITKCASGTKFTPSKYNDGENGYGYTKEVHYDGAMVKKAGVVVRNPIHVISTRFIYYSNVYAGELDWTQRYEQSRSGFLTYCEESKVKFGDEESMHWPTGYREAGIEIPCYSEVYKIVQWHNLVCETIDYMKLPQKLIYYEDFFTNYEESARGLLQFYGMAHVVPIPGTRPDQVRLTQDLYTPAEIEKVLEYIRLMASDCTKNVLSRYGV